MTTEVIAQALTANVHAFFGQGRVLYIKTAGAALNIVGNRTGKNSRPLILKNVGAGFKLQLHEADKWDTLDVVSAVNQNIELVLSDDNVDQANAVSVVGVTSVTLKGPSVLNASTTTPLATANAISIPQNLNRNSITISNVTGSTGSVFIQSVAAGAGKGTELQVGQSITITGTYAFDIRNDSGGNCTITTFEDQP